MTDRLQKTQPQIYIAEVQAIAAQPAYCESIQSGGAGGGSSGGGSSGSQSGGGTSSLFGPVYSSYSLGWYGASSPYAPAGGLAGGSKKVCYPATPGRLGSPARYDYASNYGWNAGGRSVKPIPENGYFRCTLCPSPVGIQIGFCRREFDSTYDDMQHSVVIRRDVCTVVERGMVVFGPISIAPLSVIEIKREDGTVTFLVNDTAIYSSEILSAGKLYGGTVIYGAGDYVDAPQIGATAEAIAFSAEMPALVSIISDTLIDGAVDVHIPAITLTATLARVEGVNNFSAFMPAMAAAISTNAVENWVNARLPVFSLISVLAPEEEIPNGFSAVLPPPLLSAFVRVGQSVSFSANIPVYFVASDIAACNKVDEVLPIALSMISYGEYLPANTADGSDAVLASDPHTLESAMVLVALDSLGIASSASLFIILELSALDSMSISSASSLGSIVEMLAMERVSIISRASAAKQQALQYAVNYMSGALATYQGYDFSGFVRAGGDSFAWKADGLYRIGGNNDAGEVINALVDFGATDYSSTHLKRFNAAYLGVRTDGECYLRILADDEVERVYRVVGNRNQKRAMLAKGVNSRFWNIRLELTDATYATVDNLELEIGVTTRRV